MMMIQMQFGVRQWNHSSQHPLIVQSQESAGLLHNLSGGAWDPNDVNAVASTCDSSIHFWDLRTMKKTNSIEQAHVWNVNNDPERKIFLLLQRMSLGYYMGSQNA